MLLTIIQLLRVKQYYKNLVIFLPIIFSGNFFEANLLILTFFGFVILCMASSANYIFNDIRDVKRDSVNKEKRTRPISSGEVKKHTAYLIFFILGISSIILGFYLALLFGFFIAALLILGTLYTLFLKFEPFIELIIIGINFVIRAISGAFIINVYISPWLILCPFFLALLLVSGKRKSEIEFLGDKAGIHRPVLKKYSVKIMDSLLIILACLVIISYSLYSFLSIQPIKIMFTIPLIIYGVFRYLYLLQKKPQSARHPEKILLDTKMLISIFLWGVSILWILYL